MLPTPGQRPYGDGSWARGGVPNRQTHLVQQRVAGQVQVLQSCAGSGRGVGCISVRSSTRFRGGLQVVSQYPGTTHHAKAPGSKTHLHAETTRIPHPCHLTLRVAQLQRPPRRRHRNRPYGGQRFRSADEAGAAAAVLRRLPVLPRLEGVPQAPTQP